MVSPPSVRSESTDHDIRSEEPRVPKRAGALIAVLGALTAVSPLATDMYVPGFPSMGETLHAGSSAVQLTMTAFLIGLVVGQILFGPISDTLGRRRLLIGGTTAFALFSAVCAMAPGIEILIAARFLHGMAGAVGMVLARAVLTDRFPNRELPRYFALLSQILGVAPVLAPVLGGAILSVSSWRAVFVALAVVGAALLVSVLIGVPESLPREKRRSGGVGGTFRAMGVLLRNRTFIGYVLVLGLSSGAMFTYINGSSFVFESLHGVSSGTYSLIFASTAVGMLIAGYLFAKTAPRLGVGKLLAIGVSVSLLGAAAQAVLVTALGESLIATWACLFVTMGGIGLIFPATMTLGQALGRSHPGAASALLGGFQFAFGALASPLVGLFGEDSSLPMAAIMLTALVLAGLVMAFFVRPGKASAEHGQDG